MARPVTGFRRFFTDYTLGTMKELIETEREPGRVDKLKGVLACCEVYRLAFDAVKLSREDLRASHDAMVIQMKEFKKSQDELKKTHGEIEANLRLECLQKSGLNHVCGLYEHLQDKLFAKHGSTSVHKGAEARWAIVLSQEADFRSCLQQHLGYNTNLASHLTNLYRNLSSRIHKGAGLQSVQGVIYFQRVPDLSPAECETIVCMGRVANVPVQVATP